VVHLYGRAFDRDQSSDCWQASRPGRIIPGYLYGSPLAGRGDLEATATHDLRDCATAGDLSRVAARVPAMIGEMLDAGRTVQEIGYAVSDVADNITTRLLEIAEAKLGPPPVRYAWLAAGSQGRRELTAGSDQDNGIVLDDSFRGGTQRAYFRALAGFVCDGLHQCGYVYCPGEMMAMNERWCQTLSVWRGYFSEWIEQPQPKALMLSSVCFDFRSIGGDPALFDRLHDLVLRKTERNTIFLAYLASNAISREPPIGFFRNFRLTRGGEHDGTMDLKINGITPIVELARVHALATGIPEVNTFRRLEALGAAGTLSEPGTAEMIEALELIGSLRLRHQVGMARQGRRPDNHVPLVELSSAERKRLRAAFVSVATMQSSMASKYQHGYL
jgi:CBS domain-containing protein